MCLEIKLHSCIQTAKKDIVIYKVLQLRDGVLLSPYHNYIYDIGKLESLGYDLQKNRDHWNRCYVNEGFHSFALLKDAIAEMNDFCTVMVVFKAIIPKGSKYYVGTFDRQKSIASDQIIIQKLVM